MINMPHREQQNLEVLPLHPTFAAEVRGVDFSRGISEEEFQEILGIVNKYGVVKFPATGLDDEGHIAFAARFGELDDVTPYNKLGKKNRLAHDQLFDVSNLLEDGSIAPLDSHRAAMNRGNSLFHVDSSFNPRRAGFSLLRAHTLPPPSTGGATEFADTRTAFDTLPSSLKSRLLEKDYVAHHSLLHSRKLASPDAPALKDVKPEEGFLSRHRLVQKHEATGRTNLYVASHIHHLSCVDADTGREVQVEDGGREVLKAVYEWACREGGRVRVEWNEATDLVVWDNTAVMHRSTPGEFEGRFVRDMRRATVHDGSSQAWGLNEKSDERMGFP